MSRSVTVTDGMILDVFRGVLERDFGRTEARAIDFYVDSRIALTDPDEYVRMLLRIFGAGTEYLLAAVMRGLAERFGEAPGGDALACLRAAAESMRSCPVRPKAMAEP